MSPFRRTHRTPTALGISGLFLGAMAVAAQGIVEETSPSEESMKSATETTASERIPPIDRSAAERRFETATFALG